MLLGHEFLASIRAVLDLENNVIKLPCKEIELYINSSNFKMHDRNNENTRPIDIGNEVNAVHNEERELDEAGSSPLRNLLLKYEDVFNDQRTLKPSLLVKHKIRTTDNDPVFTRNYKYPQIYKSRVEQEIESMLEKGIIRPSKSPYNSPIWVVEKKPDSAGERKIRLVVDYRKLNAKTIEDKFPLPNIDDLIFQLGNSKYFSSLDLASGFHQIEMDPESIEKTAFSTDSAHLEWVRMPFGLRNAPPPRSKER
jgi:hypothetical protein